MNINSPLLRKFITLGRIDADTVKAKQQEFASTAELISKCGKIDSNDLAEQCIDLFRVPYFDLKDFDPAQIPEDLVKEKLIRKHHILPLVQKGRKVYIAASDPTDYGAFENFEFSTGLSCEIVVVDYIQLDNKIEQLLDAAGSLDLSADEFKEFADLDSEGPKETTPKDDDKDDAPIIVYINKILMDAIKKGASDLHFEPYEHKYRIRFRIDGILHEVANPPNTLASKLSARIKVMSRLDIAEKRKPQDGRIKLKITERKSIDFRVSTMPTLWGEKIVMRILDSSSAMLGIDVLGYEEDQKKLYMDALGQPQGMILVTGPTGSGKTVSLYTGLNILNQPERNISTAEDPVEINLEGVNQVQINPKAEMTFANALRAFLRQDPDVVMVGEIRDLETAEISIKAAQTGHLVLSTLHTNSAPETITRLLNMGVPAYNVASSISLIIAQRLARRLCPKCKTPETLPAEELARQGFSTTQIEDMTLYAPKGCENCTDGYKGRVGIYEVMQITPEIAQIIMRGGNSLEIAEVSLQAGFNNLRLSGLRKAADGLTSLAEINRVTNM
ncbi:MULTISPECIES: type IV-A pilus assembly ATPase PilB [Pseudoalteromonas]|jgi:type IV pilus assembly protein PilB|uniref:Type IV-A pilus assembly ATPase PilB n=1 Tax=Pseudoalteromonas agarivorans TaxID=176102 RepID=A0AAD0U4F7_9GAMM|nr:MULTISPECIES: type IV-A pilus assembly ATPase PilB [Pseudoalteromonas]MCP4056570.1 type IV-A pilus assembly ATPase PilB [Pseudoalteromonas sp.]MDY6888154.1 type IV-A pilus assembly ATPase PilB [Pseudomonadota bacterium]AYM87750.1 type IV-A pilus assembly ATPase PilB [Pseudoalteromonas agarivorans]KPV91016.1 Type II secretion system protein E [Pseudoalteromonas sp. P1-30]KPZ59074.1 Type II secretion system protein E [Pseudoalteromonas sp. P1-13-1a]|tara:strand:+ start:2130 stop:3806 length:1677 start_codon:yes stop_codon:yes gene_type:complete